MIRGWILFSSLTLSVLFKAWPDYGSKIHAFLFSKETLNTQSWIYYIMEHLIAIMVAGCLLISDNTPSWLLKLFFSIMLADMIHFLLFYRDEGIGFNLAKVIVFGLPLAYLEITDQWKHLNK